MLRFGAQKVNVSNKKADEKQLSTLQ